VSRLKALHRPPAREPEGALVLLHGRGADERDLHGFLDLLDPDRRLLGVTPRGPLALPPGGAHWYVVRRIGFPDAATFGASFQELSELLDGLDIPPERTVLGGFSQGAVMAYALALGAGRPRPAGVIGLSGFIPAVEGFELDLAGRAGLPAFVAHGTLDPVIEVGFGRDARDRLSAAGLEVTYRESPIAHSVDPAILPDLKRWLPA
jgi:phospholipase/carboxylesterase